MRSSVLLRGLDPPAGGNYALTGSIVTVKDVEPPPIAPPTEPVGTDFDFESRTDDFAAVNAYYHSDKFFRVVRELGFDLDVYFGGTLFPTVVDHRGLGGATINAHCVGNGAYGILETAFALADLGNLAQPIGIACDYRVVLHELAGHGTLYNHVNGPNLASRTAPGTASRPCSTTTTPRRPTGSRASPGYPSSTGARTALRRTAGAGRAPSR